MSIVQTGVGVYQDTDTGNYVTPYGSGYLDPNSGAVLDAQGKVTANLRTGIGATPGNNVNAAPGPANPAGPLDSIAGFLSSIAAPAAAVGTAAINAQRKTGQNSIVLGKPPSSSSMGTIVLGGAVVVGVGALLLWLLKK